MHRILVPVDFSDTSLNALTYAIKLFKGVPLEVTILHTFKVMSSSAFSMMSIDSIVENDARVEMEALEKKIQSEFPDISIKHKIVKSDAVDIISSMGNKGVYNFIVMGTKGASGLKEVFIGSVAGGVIARTTAPVIVVPDGCEFQSMNQITYAIKSDRFNDVRTLEPLKELAKTHSSKVDILHIIDGVELDEEKLLDIFSSIDTSFTYTHGEGDLNHQLSLHLNKERPDLACLVRAEHGFFERLIGKSTTLNQTFHSQVPLLILHDY